MPVRRYVPILRTFKHLSGLARRAARVPREREEEDEDAAEGLRRSAAGTSSVTTAFVSCGISFSRKFAMRSSCRRNSRASFAVSASFSDSASVSIAW